MMMNYKNNLKLLLFFGILLIPFASSFDKPSQGQFDIFESAEDMLFDGTTKVKYLTQNNSTSNIIASSEMYVQTGSDSSSNKYLRFSTAIYLPDENGIKSLSYVRTIEGKENNIKTVNKVYKSIKGSGSTQYYYNDHCGLVSEEGKASDDWYFACFTIKFSPLSTNFDTNLKVELNINKDTTNEIYGGGASCSYSLMESGPVSITYVGTEDEFFFKQMAEPGSKVTPISYKTLNGSDCTWYENELEYDFTSAESSTLLQAKSSNTECLSHNGTHYHGLEETSLYNGYKEYYVCSDCGHRYLTVPSGSFEKERILSSTVNNTIKKTDERFLIKDISNIDATVFFNQDELGLSSPGFDESEVPSNRRGGIYTDIDGNTLNVTSYTPGDVINDVYTVCEDKTYHLKGLCVSSVIKTRNDLFKMIAKANTTGVGLRGYYVLGNDISGITGAGCGNSPGGLFGTFDGRNHVLDDIYIYGNGIFGMMYNPSVVKNVTFTNIKWGRVLCYQINNSRVSNCKFIMKKDGYIGASKGLLAYSCTNYATFENGCLIDTKNNTKSLYDSKYYDLCSIADIDNSSATYPVRYFDLEIRSLPEVQPYTTSINNTVYSPSINYNYYLPELLQDDGIPFVVDGSSEYQILYNGWYHERCAKLIARSVKEATGVTLPCNSFTEGTTIDTNNKYIVLGSTSNYSIPTTLSKSGYGIKTINNSVFITANAEDGYEVGVNKFLEYVLGYDYLNRGTPIYTRDGSVIPQLDYTNDEAFSIRKLDGSDFYTFYTDSQLNYTYNNYALDSGLTGSTVFVNTAGNIYHNSLYILDPDEYASVNPEWYAYYDYNNKNSEFDPAVYYPQYSGNAHLTKLLGQICYNARGNASKYQLMVETVATKLKNYVYSDANMAATPIKKTIMFGCQDNSEYCECDTCKAKKAQYGSNTGSVIAFLNDVADALNDTTITISFFAYKNFKNAPIINNEATITAHDQVAVFYAPIGANYNYSVGDSEHNSSTKTEIDKWSKAVSKKMLWIYQTNFSNYLYPYDSFSSTIQSIQYLKENNAIMVYPEGQHNVTLNSRTAFDALKQYLNTKYVISTSRNVGLLTAKFFRHYYGKGASYMFAFYNEMLKEMASKRASFPSICTGGINEGIASTSIWSKEILTKWLNYCITAYSKASGDSKAQSHIMAESIFPRYALITLYGSTYSSSDLLTMKSQFKSWATSLGFKITMESDKSQSGGQTNQLSAIYEQWGV